MSEVLFHTLRGSDGSLIVDIRGEVDVASSGRLRRLLADAAQQHPQSIVVDLLHVTFIDSTGLAAIAAGSAAAARLGVGFTVRRPSPFVAAQLRQTGLYDKLVTDR